MVIYIYIYTYNEFIIFMISGHSRVMLHWQHWLQCLLPSIAVVWPSVWSSRLVAVPYQVALHLLACLGPFWQWTLADI